MVKMKKEIWKDILGYEGLYQVSNYGRVRSLNYNHTGKVKLLKSRVNKHGYNLVYLFKYKLKGLQIHRLVAQAFIPNPLNLPQVNHKDENKLNNYVDNLEWCDAKYNVNYGNRNKKVANKLSKTVLQFTLDGEFVKEWSSTMECSRNGFNQGSVAACCRGERKKHKNFKWCFKIWQDVED